MILFVFIVPSSMISFFEIQKVSIELKLGVLPTVNLLNKNNDLITNRNKNSSVTFYNLIDPNNLIQIIKKAI